MSDEEIQPWAEGVAVKAAARARALLVELKPDLARTLEVDEAANDLVGTGVGLGVAALFAELDEAGALAEPQVTGS